jgi:KDO2-lipid IV(A) lauroyltransferase
VSALGEAGARLAIAVMERMARWSPAARARLARPLGTLGWWLVASRRKIALTNLRLCFPQLTERERRAIGRRHFQAMVRAAIDHGVLACASREEFEAFVKVEGAEHLTNKANRPLILVAPHFVGLDAGGLRVNTLARGVSIYARSRSRAWDEWLLAIRNRFNAPVLIAREGFNFRAAVRALHDGLPFYYLPDQDTGPQHSVFAPFFGIQAATLPMVARLAKMAGAKVVMCVTEQTAEGYVLHVEPPWPDYPSGDLVADTAHMNAQIERWARRLPEQYLWTHRRFKTRPAGEPKIY